MMEDRRRRLGTFGFGQRLASAAAIAVLAVSPAIASFADARLDGVMLAVAEAVFGEPATAQQCTDVNGNPRECTATEKWAICLANARDAAAQCIDAVPWILIPGCYAALLLDTAACTTEFLGDVALPIG